MRAASGRYAPLLVLLVVLAALGLAAVAAQVTLGRQPQASGGSASQSSSLTAATSNGQTPEAATAIYQQASKGVVMISTRSSNGFQSRQGTGSGIVVDKQGDILTNNHVIEGADQVQVTFSDGSTTNANVVSKNAAEDLATIRVQVSGSRLFPLQLGNSNNVLVGDTVYAIGAPFAHPESMTHGIVSGLNRTDPNTGLHGLIQTDAHINPGNSGGPLLNTLGQVIGINDSIVSPIEGNVGVGFAIPINSARPAEGGNL